MVLGGDKYIKKKIYYRLCASTEVGQTLLEPRAGMHSLGFVVGG